MPNPTKLPGNAQCTGARRRATEGEPLCPYLRHSVALAGRDICRSFRELSVVSFCSPDNAIAPAGRIFTSKRFRCVNDGSMQAYRIPCRLRYSRGEQPAWRLKKRENWNWSGMPTSSAIFFTGERVVRSR